MIKFPVENMRKTWLGVLSTVTCQHWWHWVAFADEMDYFKYFKSEYSDITVPESQQYTNSFYGEIEARKCYDSVKNLLVFHGQEWYW